LTDLEKGKFTFNDGSESSEHDLSQETTDYLKSIIHFCSSVIKNNEILDLFNLADNFVIKSISDDKHEMINALETDVKAVISQFRIVKSAREEANIAKEGGSEEDLSQNTENRDSFRISDLSLDDLALDFL